MAKKLSGRTSLALSKKLEKNIDRLKTINMAIVMHLPLHKNAAHRPGNDQYAELMKVVHSIEKIADRLWEY